MLGSRERGDQSYLMAVEELREEVATKHNPNLAIAFLPKKRLFAAAILLTLSCVFLLPCFTSPGVLQISDPQNCIRTSPNEDAELIERRRILLSQWESLYTQEFRHVFTSKEISPWPPHLENCTEKVQRYIRMDSRTKDGTLPRWPFWKGNLDSVETELLANATIQSLQNSKGDPAFLAFRNTFDPPWVKGEDADNLPLMRQVQRDIWIHQHPKNCSDPNLKFIFTDWESRYNLGLGALINSVAGLLGAAMRENRILVLNHFHRADHAGCVEGHALWDCYFLPETSLECKARAAELASHPESWSQGILKNIRNYSSKRIWHGPTPGQWGKPWDYMQPTTEVDNKLLIHHLAQDQRWWRAQVVRYLMRFPSKYTCHLMNKARHESFGVQAADMILEVLPNTWPKIRIGKKVGEMEAFIWEDYDPWIPRPLLSIHVRIGDKASEMKIVSFKEYMDLAYRMRLHFPHLKNIWLSTEMQSVIDELNDYKEWTIHYTNITRQERGIAMRSYEENLGMELSTNNAIINFLMATKADFFIGALGSSWCYLIDGMRTTGGKVMAGYLSVNKDRYW